MSPAQLIPIIAITAAILVLFFVRKWWTILLVIVILLLGYTTPAAFATTKVAGGPATVSNHRWCNWFQVKEQRYGALDSLLWDLQEKVTWCTNANRTKVNWLRRTWGYSTNGTFSLVSHRLSGSRARNYSWYSRRVSAVFNGPIPFVPYSDTDTPFIKIKVYANPRGHVYYNTGCGC